MDALQQRLEALEQQTEHLKHRTQAIERSLRWWRGIALGLLVLGLLSWTLPSGKAQGERGLEHRVSDLEDKLAAVTFNADAKELIVTGANLHIVNGLGSTDTTNGLGNLIVGYQEHRLAPVLP